MGTSNVNIITAIKEDHVVGINIASEKDGFRQRIVSHLKGKGDSIYDEIDYTGEFVREIIAEHFDDIVSILPIRGRAVADASMFATDDNDEDILNIILQRRELILAPWASMKDIRHDLTKQGLAKMLKVLEGKADEDDNE